MGDNIKDFSFGWLAIKLLGKSLYSNAWSALSELVANGFDAGATEVCIFIDISNKKKSTIEIFDNGSGMNEEELTTYVKVGHNKRKEAKNKDKKPMGRKGIGKLAALYLSQDYYILTKTEKADSQVWQMSYNENDINPNEKPFIKKVTEEIPLKCTIEWNKVSTGTLIKLQNVNLTGKGVVAFNDLEHKLSNYFALNNGERKIKLCVSSNGKVEFNDVHKNIAFKNMAFIKYAKTNAMSLRSASENIENKIINIPYSKQITKKLKSHSHKIEMSHFEDIESILIKGTVSLTMENGKEKEFKYSLEGWIGIHSTIKIKDAQINDDNFKKTSHYNPNQLRLYVRDKLAIENFLNIIDNTQAFVNYIEGEISFDLLDEDELPDIATSNRQNMDEHDERIKLLINLVKPIIKNLIKKRNELAKKVKIEEDDIEKIVNDGAKEQFANDLKDEIENLGDNISEEQKSSFARIITNKIKGEIVKHDYLIFLSHSRANSKFTDFVYYLLESKGVEPCEMFYTSKDKTIQDFESLETLESQIKKNIVNENTLLVYLTSEDYKGSEYCMFEGGAGWATRATGDFLVLTLEYKNIPRFLTKGNINIVLEESLTNSNYAGIVSSLNKMIVHINKGRKMKKESVIDLFEEIKFPNKVELQRKGQTSKDLMDNDIKLYWKTYVEEHKDN